MVKVGRVWTGGTVLNTLSDGFYRCSYVGSRRGGWNQFRIGNFKEEEIKSDGIDAALAAVRALETK